MAFPFSPTPAFRPRGQAAAPNPLTALEMPETTPRETDYRRLQGPAARDYTGLAQQQDREDALALQQQRRNDALRRQEQEQEQRAVNSEAEARFRAEDRPFFTDALGRIRPVHDDQTWEKQRAEAEQQRAQKTLQTEARKAASLAAAARTGMGSPLDARSRKSLEDDVALKESTLDATARDAARQAIEQSPTYKAANTGYFDLALDKQPEDEAGKALLADHARLKDSTLPLEPAMMERIRSEYADPAAKAALEEQKKALNADTAKRQQIETLARQEARAKAIADGNDPAVVAQAIPPSADELQASTEEDTVKLAALKERGAAGVKGAEVQEHAAEERATFARLQQTQEQLAKTRQTEQQDKTVQRAASDAQQQQTAMEAVTPVRPLAPLAEKDGAMVDDADPLAKGKVVAKRDAAGALNVATPAALERVMRQSGDSPVYLAPKDEAAALIEDAKRQGRGLELLPQIVEAKRKQGTELPAQRAAVAKDYDARMVELQKFHGSALKDAAPQRAEIQGRLNRGEIDEAQAATLLTNHLREIESRYEAEAAKRQATLVSAMREFGAGTMSAQQLDKVFAAAGRGSGVEAYQEHRAEIEKLDKAVSEGVQLSLGEAGWWNRKEGADPRITPEFRDAKIKAGFDRYTITQPDGTVKDYYNPEGIDIHALDADGTSPAIELAKRYPAGTKIERAAPESAAGKVEDRAQFKEGIAAFEKKIDAKLAPYNFDDATKAAAKKRIELEAMRQLPRDVWEQAKDPKFWAGNTPFVGGFIHVMSPVAGTVAKLQNNEPITQEEAAALNEVLIEMDRPNTWAANTLSIATQSASFGLELAATSGVGSLVRKGVTKVAEGALAAGFRSLATAAGRKAVRDSLATKTAAGIIDMGLVRPAFQPGGVFKKASEDNMKGIAVEQGEDGRLVANLDKTVNPGSIWKALPDAYLYQGVENASEAFGSFLRASGASAALAKMTKPARDALMKRAVVKAIAKANPTKAIGKIGTFLRKANVDSFPEEWVEEIAGSAGHAIFNGEEFTLPSAEDTASLFVSMLIPGSMAAYSQHREKQATARQRQAASVAHQSFAADLADPVRAAARLTEDLGTPVSPDVIKNAAALVGPVSAGDRFRDIEASQADMDMEAEKAEQAGDFPHAARLREIAAEHERAKTPAMLEDLAHAIEAVEQLEAATQQAEAAAASAPDDVRYAAAQQRLAAVKRASAVVKIARGRGHLLTTDEQAALAVAPTPAVVNEGAGDIITDSSITEARRVAPAAAALIRQNETQRREQLSQQQAQVVSPGQAAPSPAAAPQPGSPGGIAPNAGGAPAASGAQDAQVPGAATPAAPGAAPVTTGQNPAATPGAAAPAPQGSQTGSPTSSGKVGTWSVTGKAKDGTMRAASIPASAATSTQQAREKLAEQFDLGDVIDWNSLIPPKDAPAPAPAKTDAKAQGKPAASPHRATLDAAIQTRVPRSMHKKAGVVADHVAALLDSFAPLFKKVQFAPVSKGSGFEVSPDGTLKIDIARLTGSAPENTSGEWLRAAFTEEIIHRAAVETITDAQAVAFWQKLGTTEEGRALQSLVVDGYYAAGSKPAQPDPWQMAHEFVRMMVQDKAFARRVTEAMEVDPGLAETLREFLRNIANYIRQTFSKLPENLRAEAEQMEQAVIARLRELGVPLDITEDATTPQKKAKTKADLRGESKADSITTGTPEIPASSGVPMVRGKKHTIYTTTGEAVEVQWAVVEAADLITSHDLIGRANPKFDASLQNRKSREQGASEATVKDIAAKTKYARLSDASTAVDGAPVIGSDMQVEAGNGRAMGISLAYAEARKNAGDYKQDLLADAEAKGLDKEAVARMNAPVLVRVRLTNVKRAEFAADSNAPTATQLDERELAVQDAKRLTPEALAGLTVTADGDLFTRENREFFSQFFRATVTTGEVAALTDENGQLKQAGLRRMRNAIFVAAYGESPATMNAFTRLIESVEEDPARNIGKAMIAAAPAIARLRALAATGARQNLDIGPDVAAAAATYARLKEEGTSVADYFSQGQIVSDGMTPLQNKLLQFFEDNKRSAGRIAEALNRFTGLVDREGDPRQGDIFRTLGEADASSARTKASTWEQAAGAAGTLAAAERAQAPVNLPGVPKTMVDRAIAVNNAIWSKVQSLVSAPVARYFAAPDTDVVFLVKPIGIEMGGDALLRRFIKRHGGIISEEWRGRVTAERMEAHYAEHKGKPFFPKLTGYYQGREVIAYRVKVRADQIDALRDAVGKSSVPKDQPSLRGSIVYAGHGAEAGWNNLAVDPNLNGIDNGIHLSDSVEAGRRESVIWFSTKAKTAKQPDPAATDLADVMPGLPREVRRLTEAAHYHAEGEADDFMRDMRDVAVRVPGLRVLATLAADTVPPINPNASLEQTVPPLLRTTLQDGETDEAVLQSAQSALAALDKAGYKVATDAEGEPMASFAEGEAVIHLVRDTDTTVDPLVRELRIATPSLIKRRTTLFGAVSYQVDRAVKKLRSVWALRPWSAGGTSKWEPAAQRPAIAISSASASVNPSASISLPSLTASSMAQTVTSAPASNSSARVRLLHLVRQTKSAARLSATERARYFFKASSMPEDTRFSPSTQGQMRLPTDVERGHLTLDELMMESGGLRDLSGAHAAGLPRVVRIGGNARRRVYRQVWSMLETPYASIGVPFKNADALLAEKAVFDVALGEGGRPTAFAIVKPGRYGYKVISFGTDGSSEGKLAARAVLNRLKSPGYWAELSGAPEHIAKKAGVPAVPARIAVTMVKRAAELEDSDGIHYSREISGLDEPHTKAVYGVPWNVPQTQALASARRPTADQGDYVGNLFDFAAAQPRRKEPKTRESRLSRFQDAQSEFRELPTAADGTFAAWQKAEKALESAEQSLREAPMEQHKEAVAARTQARAALSRAKTAHTNAVDGLLKRAPLSSATRPRPAFIVPLEERAQAATIPYETDPLRNPRIALEFLQGQGQGGNQGEGEIGISGAPADDNRSRPDSRLSGAPPQAGRSLPRLALEPLEDGLAPLERFNGDEHDVWYDETDDLAIKATKDKALAGGVEAYLKRLIVGNETFDDAAAVEGWVTLSGEPQPRLITSQPWIDGDPSTEDEIDTYMRRKGFLKAMDGVWWREKGDLWITDVLPKNARTDDRGRVHLIDFLTPQLSDRQADYYMQMVLTQPQPEPTPEPADDAPAPEPAATTPEPDKKAQHGVVSRLRRFMFGSDGRTLSSATRPMPADALRALDPVYVAALAEGSDGGLTPREGAAPTGPAATVRWFNDAIGKLTPDQPAHFRYGSGFHGRLSMAHGTDAVPRESTFLEVVHEENPGHALLELPVSSGIEAYRAITGLQDTIKADREALQGELANSEREASQAGRDALLSPAKRLASVSDLVKSADTEGRKAIVAAARDFTPFDGLSYRTTALQAAERPALQSGERPRLAPNGRPSKLNERQWQHVRTPQFKAWFGEWETLAKRETLRSMSSMAVDDRFAGLSGDSLRHAAKQYFKSTLMHGTPVMTTDGRAVEFTMRGYREMQHHSADSRVLQIVPSLPDMLHRAVPLWSEPHTEAGAPNIKAWHHYGIKARLNGRDFYARLLLREDNDGHTHYDADATSVELLDNENGEESPNQPDRKPSAGEGQTALAKNRLHQWWHSVNPATVSKVVDENGEPLVVYHGAPDVRGIFADGFQPFSRGTVFFGSDSARTAGTYADDRRAFDYQKAEPGTIPLYVSIQNPMVIDAKGRNWRDTAKHVDEARAAGHDGIIIRNVVDDYQTTPASKPATSYAWFAATKSKSALTDPIQSKVDGLPIEGTGPNNGDFDPQNPSILKSQVQADRNDTGTEIPLARTDKEAMNVAAKSAATKINKLLPGMGEIIVVRNGGTLRNKTEFAAMRLSDQDVRDIVDGKIQGFYSVPLNKTVILTDHIKALEGEGHETAAARVILHENAHKGAAILRRAPAMQKRWEGLAKEIRQAFGHELDAIAGEPGYARLAGNDSALADEWAARKLGGMTVKQVKALQPQSLLRRVFNYFMDALRRLLGAPQANDAVIADVRDWLARSRDAVRPVGIASRPGVIRQAMERAGSAVKLTAEQMAARAARRKQGWRDAMAMERQGASQADIHEKTGWRTWVRGITDTEESAKPTRWDDPKSPDPKKRDLHRARNMVLRGRSEADIYRETGWQQVGYPLTLIHYDLPHAFNRWTPPGERVDARGRTAPDDGTAKTAKPPQPSLEDWLRDTTGPEWWDEWLDSQPEDEPLVFVDGVREMTMTRNDGGDPSAPWKVEVTDHGRPVEAFQFTHRRGAALAAYRYFSPDAKWRKPSSPPERIRASYAPGQPGLFDAPSFAPAPEAKPLSFTGAAGQPKATPASTPANLYAPPIDAATGRESMSAEDARAAVESFFTEPDNPDYWPADIRERFDEDPLDIAINYDGEYPDSDPDRAPLLPEPLRNDPKHVAWRRALHDEATDADDPIIEAANDWTQSKEAKKLADDNKARYQAEAEARARDTIKQLEARGWKWNEKDKTFEEDERPVLFSAERATAEGPTNRGALKVYRELTALRETQGRLTPNQQRMLDVAEAKLGQTFLFDDMGKEYAPAQDLRLESELATGTAPRAEQLTLFSGTRATEDPDIRAGLDLLAERIPDAVLRDLERQSGSWFESSDPLEELEGRSVQQRGLLDMAYHQRRTSQTHDQWNDAARSAVATDEAGVTRELVDDVLMHGVITNPTKIKAAQLLIPQMFRKAVATGDKQALRDAQALAWGYDIAGTETARALASRWQPHQTPEEAHREMLAKMIFTPTPAARDEVQALPTPGEKARRIAALEKELAQARADLARTSGLLSQANADRTTEQVRKGELKSQLAAYQAEVKTLTAQLEEMTRQKDRFQRLAEITGERMKRIEDELGKLGITLHDLFVSKEVVVRLRGSALVKRALEPFTEQERRAIKLMFDGMSDRQISKALGLHRTAVNALQDRAETAMLDVFTEWTKRGFSLADMESLDAEGNRVNLDEVMNDDGTLKSARKATGDIVPDDVARERAREMLRALLPESKVRNSGARKRLTGKKGEGFDIANPSHAVSLARTIQAVDASIPDMLMEYWFNSILSGIATHTANIIGNTANMTLGYALQRNMEAGLNLIFRQADQAAFGEQATVLKSAAWAAKEAWGELFKAFRSENDMFESTWLGEAVGVPTLNEKTGASPKHAIPGRAGRIIRIPGRLLMAMDAFFKHLIGRMEATAQAYRIATSEKRTGADREKRIRGLVMTPGSAAWVLAVRKAQEDTFTTELRSKERQKKDGDWIPGTGHIEDYASRFSSLRAGSKLLTLMFPFVRTPFNILRTGFRKSPLGTFNMALRGSVGLWRMKDGTPFFESYPKALLFQHAAEQFIAYGVTALIAGMVEGDDDDDDKRILITGSRDPHNKAGDLQFMQRNRGGETTLLINGKPVLNFGRYEPLTSMVLPIIDAVRELKLRKHGLRNDDVLWRIFAHIKTQATEKTFLQGLSNLAGALDRFNNPDKNTSAFLKSNLSTLVPNIIRQTLRNTDQQVRDTKNADWQYSFLPFGGWAEPLYDLYGRPVEKTGTPVSRLFMQSSTKPQPMTQADRAIWQWNSTHPLESYWPVNPTRRSEGGIFRYRDPKDPSGKSWLDLTPAQAALMRKERGQELSKLLPVIPYGTNPKEEFPRASTRATNTVKKRYLDPPRLPYIPPRPMSLREMMGWGRPRP